MFIALVPAYNESERITGVVRSLLGKKVDEVVVIDDGSSDDTALRARDAGATVLIHEINLGQGAALETGHEYARQKKADFVLHFDGDGQFDVDDISRAKEMIEQNNTDIVLGSRFLGKNSSVPWFKRHILLPIGRIINRIFTGLSLTDAHNGFRVLNSRAFTKIQLKHNRMAHATEILEQITKHKLVFREIPITVTYREYGQRMKSGFTILKDLIIGKFVG